MFSSSSSKCYLQKIVRSFFIYRNKYLYIKKISNKSNESSEIFVQKSRTSPGFVSFSFFKCLVGDEHQSCPAPIRIAEDAYEQLKDAAQELNLEWSAVESAYRLDPLNNYYSLLKPWVSSRVFFHLHLWPLFWRTKIIYRWDG